MNHDNYPDNYIRGILNTTKTIAMVGVSPKENRPSYFAFKYLLERGYRMIPVNPGQAGKELLGQTFYAKLSDIPDPIDMVDIFRASEHVMPIVEEALALTPLDRVLVETDAPFLTPTPYRGRPNASYLVPVTVRAMAEVLGADLETLCRAVDANTEAAFGGAW